MLGGDNKMELGETMSKKKVDIAFGSPFAVDKNGRDGSISNLFEDLEKDGALPKLEMVRSSDVNWWLSLNQ